MWSAVLAGPMAAIEGWAFADGFWFLLGIMTASTTGYTAVAPTPFHGMMFSVLFDAWSLALACIEMRCLDQMIVMKLALATGLSAGVTPVPGLGCCLSSVTDVTGSRRPTLRFCLLQLSILTLVIVPAFTFLFSLAFGAILAGIEEWPLLDGFFFICAIAVGATNPYITSVPTKPVGLILTGVIGSWAYGMFALVMLLFAGPVSEPLAVWARVHYHDRQLHGREAAWKLLLVLLVGVPLWTGTWAAIPGPILAIIEGWPFKDGFNFCLGVMTGSTVGFTKATPVTTPGIMAALYFDSLSIEVAALIFSLIGFSMIDQLCLDIGFSAGLSQPWFWRKSGSVGSAISAACATRSPILVSAQ